MNTNEHKKLISNKSHYLYTYNRYIIFTVQLLFKDQDNSNYFIKNGKELLTNLLSFANKDTASFGDAFNDLIGWLKCTDNWQVVDEELTGRGVRTHTVCTVYVL